MNRNIINRIYNKLAFFSPGGNSIRIWLHKKRGVIIGKNVWISQFVYIDELHPECVVINDNSTIGLRTSIFTHFYWGNKNKESKCRNVIINKNVFVGPHCIILPGVVIGEGAVVKAGSVITTDVPSFTFWGAPSCGPIARAEIPLTSEYSYEEFIRGLKPIRSRDTKINE